MSIFLIVTKRRNGATSLEAPRPSSDSVFGLPGGYILCVINVIGRV